MAKYIKEQPSAKFKMKKPDYSYSKREVTLMVVIVIFIILAGVYAYWVQQNNASKLDSINSFEDCVAANNPVLESFPERCIAGEKMYVKQY